MVLCVGLAHNEEGSPGVSGEDGKSWESELIHESLGRMSSSCPNYSLGDPCGERLELSLVMQLHGAGGGSLEKQGGGDLSVHWSYVGKQRGQSSFRSGSHQPSHGPRGLVPSSTVHHDCVALVPEETSVFLQGSSDKVESSV